MKRATEHTTWRSVFSADVLEFINTSIDFCSMLEQEQEDLRSFVWKLQKNLIVLYGKGLVLSAMQNNLEQDDLGNDLEQYVTEEQYNGIRSNVASILGSYDDYLDVFVEDMKYSDQPILKTISEDVADIYQVLANFVSACQQGIDEIKYAALVHTIQEFCEYWGARALSAMRALHEVYFYSDNDEQ